MNLFRIKKKKGLSLHNVTFYDKISFGFIAISICLVLLLIISGIRESEDKYIHQVRKNMEYMSQNYEIQIDRYILNKISMLQYMQTFPAIYEMDWEVQKEFIKERSAILGFQHIFIVDNKGFGYYLDGNEEKIKDQSNEPFVKDIMTQEVMITEPFSQPELKRTIVTICVAIHNNNGRVGTICGTIDLNELREIISVNEITNNGKFMFLNCTSAYNKQGEYLAGTDVTEQDIFTQASLFDKEVNDGENNKFAIVHKSMEQGKNKFGTILLDGNNCFAHVTYLEDYKWVVIQYIDKSTIFSNIREKYFWLILLMGVTIMLTFMSALIITDFLHDNQRLCTDPMTGINNRLAFDSYLDKLENNYDKSISIIFFDLNNFKYANDVFGHDNGDKLLKILAKSLENSFGYHTEIFRLGGDEFVSVGEDFSETNIRTCWLILNSILDAESSKLDFNYTISASYGYAIRYKGYYDNLHILMEKADRNMYVYKENWKNKNGRYR